MATVVFGGKIGYQGHPQNPVEIGASPGVAKHQGLSWISKQIHSNLTKILTIAERHRVDTIAKIRKYRPTKALASQKRFHCLQWEFICGGSYFKQRKWRTVRDWLRKLAFRQRSSSSSFTLLSSLTRGHVVYIILVINIFTNYFLLGTKYRGYRSYVIRVIHSRYLERKIIILQTMVT